MGPKKNSGSNKIWVPKKIFVKNNLGPIKFGYHKSLGPEKILVPKKFGSRTNFDPKKFEPQKDFGPINVLLGWVGLGCPVQGWVRLVD